MKTRKAKTVTTPDPRPRLLSRQLLISVVALLFLLPPVTSHNDLLFAQKSRGKPYAVIVGTVWGPDDHPVYGVPVKIRRSQDKPNKVRWQAISDHHGEFEVQLPAKENDYILSADLKGFKTTDGKQLRLVKEVTVHIYHDERQDVGLHLEF
jgi:hypothetical protein